MNGIVHQEPCAAGKKQSKALYVSGFSAPIRQRIQTYIFRKPANTLSKAFASHPGTSWFSYGSASETPLRGGLHFVKAQAYSQLRLLNFCLHLRLLQIGQKMALQT